MILSAGTCSGDCYIPDGVNGPDFLALAAVLQQRATGGRIAFSEAWGDRIFRPLVMDPGGYSKLFDDLAALAALVESVPARFFGGDLCSLGAALGLEDAPLNVLRRLGRTIPLRSLRADIVLHPAGPSVVELNWGSRLGGYDIDGLAPAVAAAFRACYGHGHRFRESPTDALVEALEQQLPPGVLLADIDLTVVCGGEVSAESPMMKSIVEHLSLRLPKVALLDLNDLPRYANSLSTSTCFPVVLRYFQVDDLTSDTALVDAVAKLYYLDAEVRAVFWTGLEGAVFASKGMLSILHELASSGALTEDEATVVRETVAPTWDARALPEDWASASELVGLPLESLLFKPKRGLGGGGIVAGADIEPADVGEAWRAARDHDLVIQRRLDPIPVVAAPESGSAASWRLVFGAFLTPLGPGGLVVRARPWHEKSAVVSASGSLTSRVGTALVLDTSRDMNTKGVLHHAH